MKNCPDCGVQCEDNQLFCANCGAILSEAKEKDAAELNETVAAEVAEPVVVEETATEAQPEAEVEAKGKLNIGLLVWSIINILMCCSSFFGIASLVLTIIASFSSFKAYKLQTKIAFVLNLVASIGMGLLILVYIIYIVICFIWGMSVSFLGYGMYY